MANQPIVPVLKVRIFYGTFCYAAQFKGPDGRFHPDEDQTPLINYGTAAVPQRQLDFGLEYVYHHGMVSTAVDRVGWFQQIWPIVEGALLTLPQLGRPIPMTEHLAIYGTVLIHCKTPEEVVVPRLAADAVASVATAFAPHESETPTEEELAPEAKHNRQASHKPQAYTNTPHGLFSH